MNQKKCINNLQINLITFLFYEVVYPFVNS